MRKAKHHSLDWERLNLVTESKEEQHRLLNLFFQLAEEKLVIMEHSLRLAKTGEWNAVAHYLKGSAANLGMPRMTDLCRRAEHMDADDAEAAAVFEKIRAELDYIHFFIIQ